MQNHVEEKYKISRDTTRKLIDLMESKGIIKISKPERAGMPHYLSINEDNHYNQIFQAFTATNQIVDDMEEQLKKLTSLIGQHVNQHKSNHTKLGQEGCSDCMLLTNLIRGFLADYEDSVVGILDVLLVRARESFITRDDRVRLYDDILDLKRKCWRQIGPLYGPRSYQNNLYVTLTNEDKEYLKQHGISFDSILAEFKELSNSCKILSADKYTSYFDPSKLTHRVEFE